MSLEGQMLRKPQFEEEGAVARSVFAPAVSVC